MLPPETFSRGTPELDPWYVTGFVEGEGTFTFSRSGPQMALYFAIKLTGSDRTILEAIQAYFGGIGSIYNVKPAAPTQASGYTKSAAYYRVCRSKDLDRVVEHFDTYPLRGSKAASYAIWREMVVLKRAFRKPARPELEALAARLSAASPRNGRWE
jgi:LAGLIDADG DNA endonuclease family protein